LVSLSSLILTSIAFYVFLLWLLNHEKGGSINCQNALVKFGHFTTKLVSDSKASKMNGEKKLKKLKPKPEYIQDEASTTDNEKRKEKKEKKIKHHHHGKAEKSKDSKLYTFLKVIALFSMVPLFLSIPYILTWCGELVVNHQIYFVYLWCGYALIQLFIFFYWKRNLITLNSFVTQVDIAITSAQSI
jgi:hypothetical protein